MISNQLIIFLNVIAMILLGRSWYIHYKVKDGLARIMLLWGCTFIFLFLASKTLTLFLLEIKTINLDELKLCDNCANLFIYLTISGQWYIQRHHSQRDEDDKLQKDKIDLKRLRKK